MENIIVKSIINIGYNIHKTIKNVKNRNLEDNYKWGKFLKNKCQQIILAEMDILNKQGIPVIDSEMPYNACNVGKGLGKNILVVKEKNTKTDKRIYCFCDIIDGTWNAVCGCEFTASTVITFSNLTDKKIEDITIDDFCIGAIIPLHGKGVYYGIKNKLSILKTWNGDKYPLHLTTETDSTKIRYFMDLFTTQTYSQLLYSIKTMIPVMSEFADFARFYGAGVETISLFGYKNIMPGFGGFISANQKTDNIIAGKIIVENIGGIVSDWNGKSVNNYKLHDRINIIMASNKELYERFYKLMNIGMSLPELPHFEFKKALETI